MTNEINAHAAASVATDATANATPAVATSHCCLDSSPCVRHASDLVAEAAARRVEIEAARDRLETAAMEYAAWGHVDKKRSGSLRRLQRAAEDLKQLRKGTT